MARELKVIQDFYDLSKRVLKFPRNVRYGLGLAIEQRLQELLALLVRAKYAPAAGKAPLLRAANVELEVLRFQVRQAAELRALSPGGHLFAVKGLAGVGAQVGGWLKAVPAP